MSHRSSSFHRPSQTTPLVVSHCALLQGSQTSSTISLSPHSHLTHTSHTHTYHTPHSHLTHISLSPLTHTSHTPHSHLTHISLSPHTHTSHTPHSRLTLTSHRYTVIIYTRCYQTTVTYEQWSSSCLLLCPVTVCNNSTSSLSTVDSLHSFRSQLNTHVLQCLIPSGFWCTIN